MGQVTGWRLVKAMLFGVVGAALGLAFNAAISYLQQDWTNPLGIGLAVALASISGILPLLQQERQEAPPRPPPPGRPVPTPTRMPVFLAVVVLLLACGGGAGALAFGVQYLGGLITGDEDGVPVLVGEKSARAGALTLTVREVWLTRHFTRVAMTAANSGDQSLSLPVFGYCQLNPQGGTTLEGHSFRSDWPDTVPAEESVRGIVNFDRLPAGTTRISVSFTQVFGPSGGSITVRDLVLRPG